MSEAKRQPDVNLNFLGGIGMYHKTAQITKNRNRFKFPHQLPQYSIQVFKTTDTPGTPTKNSEMRHCSRSQGLKILQSS